MDGAPRGERRHQESYGGPDSDARREISGDGIGLWRHASLRGTWPWRPRRQTNDLMGQDLHEETLNRCLGARQQTPALAPQGRSARYRVGSALAPGLQVLAHRPRGNDLDTYECWSWTHYCRGVVNGPGRLPRGPCRYPPSLRTKP